MKQNKSIFIVFGLLIVAASLYRVWDGRPLGFAPQIAMAVFAGAIIKDKKWAIILPILSMFISDVLYEVLYSFNLTEIKGFYAGQITNYILFAGMVVFGFMIKKINWIKISAAAIAAPTTYFIISNFLVWMGGGGLYRPKTFDGLLMSYNDALPFYRGSLAATLVFSAIFFGGYFLAKQYFVKPAHQLA
jgi:hypothetical protein